jgi:hypothetical protein
MKNENSLEIRNGSNRRSCGIPKKERTNQKSKIIVFQTTVNLGVQVKPSV